MGDTRRADYIEVGDDGIKSGSIDRSAIYSLATTGSAEDGAITIDTAKTR